MRPILCCVACFFAAEVVSAADVVPFGSSWHYLNPQTAAEIPGVVDVNFDANWFKPNFNVSAPNQWSGPSPGPFARVDEGSTDNRISAFTPDNSAFVREPGTLMLLPASGDRLTTYYRHEFTTTSSFTDLAIEYLADDGVEFFLDGIPILRGNCCQTSDRTPIAAEDPVGFSDLALRTGDERNYTTQPILIGQELAPGTHVLAAAVYQDRPTSNDMGFSARILDGYIYRPLVESPSEWSYHIGFDEPSGGNLDWTQSGFNDGSWDKGQDGFGYDTDTTTNNLPLINTPVDEMVDTVSSLYLRQSFSVTDTSELKELVLSVDYDDSFVAYINGVEVVRAGAPGEIGVAVPFDALGASHESTNANGDPGEAFPISLSAFPNLLDANGNNVLAIHGLNTTLDSSDFLLAQIELAGLGGVAAGIRGDFDDSGALDVADIDSLTTAALSGTNPSEYDLDGNGTVDTEDRRIWIEDIKNTWFGDSNLDGLFSTTDFVEVFTAGEFEDTIPGNSTWATGDWDGNGDFGTGDFVAAFTAGGFEAGQKPGGVNVAAVPEPAGLGLVISASLGLTLLRRRSK